MWNRVLVLLSILFISTLANGDSGPADTVSSKTSAYKTCMHEYGKGHSKVGIMPLELADAASDHCSPILGDLHSLYDSAIKSQTSANSDNANVGSTDDKTRLYLEEQVKKVLAELEAVARKDVMTSAVGR